MFVQEDFYQAEPDVVAAVITQLSMKAGLRAWGDKDLSAVKSDMTILSYQEGDAEIINLNLLWGLSFLCIHSW